MFTKIKNWFMCKFGEFELRRVFGKEYIDGILDKSQIEPPKEIIEHWAKLDREKSLKEKKA